MVTLSAAPQLFRAAHAPAEQDAAPLDKRFVVAWGSVSGRHHRRLQRDNQDGVAVAATPQRVVIAVADGCSAGRHSEVGARLCARWLCAWLPRYAPRAGALADVEQLAAVGAGLQAFLRGWALALCPDPAALPAVVQDFCLTTVLAAILDDDHLAIIGAGDGAFSVNGQLTVLEPGPGNRPAYLAYAMLERDQLARDAPRPRLALHRILATTDVDSVLLATDGLLELRERPQQPLRDGSLVGGPEQFERQPRFVHNPSLVQKRLTQLAAVEGLLEDDTTAVLLRRRAAPGGAR